MGRLRKGPPFFIPGVFGLPVPAGQRPSHPATTRAAAALTSPAAL